MNCKRTRPVDILPTVKENIMNSLLKAPSLQVFFVQAIESGGPKPQTS